MLFVLYIPCRMDSCTVRTKFGSEFKIIHHTLMYVLYKDLRNICLGMIISFLTKSLVTLAFFHSL